MPVVLVRRMGGQREVLDGSGVAIAELALVPVGVDRLRVAGGVELGDLFFGEIPAERAEILAELLLVAGAHDDVDDGGTLQKPVERNLRDGLSGFFGDFVDSVDNFVEIFVLHLRAVGCGFVEARNCRDGLIAANLAGEASPA